MASKWPLVPTNQSISPAETLLHYRYVYWYTFWWRLFSNFSYLRAAAMMQLAPEQTQPLESSWFMPRLWPISWASVAPTAMARSLWSWEVTNRQSFEWDSFFYQHFSFNQSEHCLLTHDKKYLLPQSAMFLDFLTTATFGVMVCFLDMLWKFLYLNG